MRLAVLDVGSNTVHLLMVDAHRGAHPKPMSSDKDQLRLAENLDPKGALTKHGVLSLIESVHKARDSAQAAGCDDLLAFATSALRDATNSAEVLAKVFDETGVDLQVLPGEDEARYTFLAVRRWCGWSAGRLLVLDIGGGSLELAVGRDEMPEATASLPLGAGRLTREWFSADPPGRAEIDRLRAKVEADLAPVAGRLRTSGDPDRAVGTSKTFRTLARLAGAAPSSEGPRAHRTLSALGLRQLTAFISRMSSGDLAELEGVSGSRSHQLVAGAIVALASMEALGVAELDICPWALREGVILRRFDMLDGMKLAERASAAGSSTPTTRGDRSAQEAEGGLGPLTSHRARWTE